MTILYPRSSKAVQPLQTRLHMVALLLLLAVCAPHLALAQQPVTAPAAASHAFSAADIGTGTRPIDGLWQFHLGDDPAWAQPGWDDRAWERLPADQPWGDAGHPGYYGYAWYRRQIALDPTDKKPLGLLLPPLDAVAEVYWNGVKIGGVGTMPPHPAWFNLPQPVAIPLPSTVDARTGVLAIRVWERFLDNIDPPDAGGFQSAPLLGYRPLIQKMPNAWAEHRWRERGVRNIANVLCLIAGIAALVLWARSPSQWVLLFVGLYFGSYAVTFIAQQFVSISWLRAQLLGTSLSTITKMSSVGLILFLADLPRRPGVKGFRFWARVCVASSFFTLLNGFWGLWEVVQLLFRPAALSGLQPTLESIYGYGFPVFQLTLLVVCLIFRRRTAARVLFMLAVGFDITIQLIVGLSTDFTGHLAWLLPILRRPVFLIYGSSMSLFALNRMLVLLTVAYAVWDQLSQQLHRQRFVDAELKAAQEIQQVLVPATAEREARGYTVSSVYRPASEVGGDFFQIISLEGNGTGDGTLIVAGDVSGKGLRAAMTVSLVVGALRTLAEYDPEPAAVLAGLNRRLIGRTQGGFVTCCAVRIDAHGRATMANAGHCQPYLDGHEIELPNGLPLGIVEDVEYEEVELEVPEGQQLTLLSDGVVEARNHHGELYGFDRLNRLMQQRPTAEHVAASAVSFGQDDDITVLTLTRLATA
jgi:hypothetical protein